MSLPFLLLSCLAGVLTVLSPCVLPILPTVVAGSLTGWSRGYGRPLLIILALVVAVVVFTLTIKTTTLVFTLNQTFWTYLSGGLLALVGLFYLFPDGWERLVVRWPFAGWAQRRLQSANARTDFWGPIVIGLSLGPVFTSCSPTYMLLVGMILPVDVLAGTVYLLAYVLGLGAMLWLIAVFSLKLTTKLRWGVNPRGYFRRSLGLLFLLIGGLIVTGWDKDLQAWLIAGGFTGSSQLETWLKLWLGQIATG